MQIPSRSELERLFDDERADEVHFVETVGSWPSLRILDHLYTSEPVTTGDIARELNMDMRDVKDHLDALERHKVVEETNDGWQTRTDRISIRLTRSNGLKIVHEIGSEEKQKNEQSDPQSDTETSESIISRIRQLIWFS